MAANVQSDQVKVVHGLVFVDGVKKGHVRRMAGTAVIGATVTLAMEDLMLNVQFESKELASKFHGAWFAPRQVKKLDQLKKEWDAKDPFWMDRALHDGEPAPKRPRGLQMTPVKTTAPPKQAKKKRVDPFVLTSGTVQKLDLFDCTPDPIVVGDTLPSVQKATDGELATSSMPHDAMLNCEVEEQKQVASFQKTKEVRPADDAMEKVHAGAVILLHDPAVPLTAASAQMVSVTKVENYASVKELLKTEGVEACMPGVSTKTAQKRFAKRYSHKEDLIRDRGVVCLHIKPLFYDFAPFVKQV